MNKEICGLVPVRFTCPNCGGDRLGKEEQIISTTEITHRGDLVQEGDRAELIGIVVEEEFELDSTVYICLGCGSLMATSEGEMLYILDQQERDQEEKQL
jgi:DNA-directed RNA polymerase subunit RPC12/RpoP